MIDKYVRLSSNKDNNNIIEILEKKGAVENF